MKWKPFRLGDKVYDLTHLHPFQFEYLVLADAKNSERRYLIDAHFGLHCFTHKPEPGRTHVAELSYSDSREMRIFCPHRYEWSKKLPDIIRGIGDRKCFHTHHGNFFTIELVDHEGQRVEYTVYFTLTKPKKKALTLFVQSAYMPDGAPKPQTRNHRPIKFMILAHNIANGKLIKPPPN